MYRARVVPLVDFDGSRPVICGEDRLHACFQRTLTETSGTCEEVTNFHDGSYAATVC